MNIKTVITHGIAGVVFYAAGTMAFAAERESSESCDCPAESSETATEISPIEASVSKVPDTVAPAAELPVREAVQHVVEIHKFKFSAPLLDVRIGDQVTWTNMDIVPHTATALDKSWDSGLLKKGQSFTLTITDATSLAYFCLYHPHMKAKLQFIDAETNLE